MRLRLKATHYFMREYVTNAWERNKNETEYNNKQQYFIKLFHSNSLQCIRLTQSPRKGIPTMFLLSE